MKKTTIILFHISLMFLFSTASGAEKSDSPFMRYEAIYPAFKAIVDSLLHRCPDNCAYIMDLYRDAGSEQTQISVQRFETNREVPFSTASCYGVICYENSFIYIEGDKEYDLLADTGEYITADLIRKSDYEWIDDSNPSLFIFDKLHLYTIGDDLTPTNIRGVPGH